MQDCKIEKSIKGKKYQEKKYFWAAQICQQNFSEKKEVKSKMVIKICKFAYIAL